MNKRIRNKKEKMRLARLRAAELGQVFTEMDDDTTVLSFVEAHKNDIPKNDADSVMFDEDDDDEELVYDPVFDDEDDKEDDDEELVYDPVFDDEEDVSEESKLTEQELLAQKAHEAAVAARIRAQEQIAREKEQEIKEAEEKAMQFAESTGCFEDEKIIENRDSLESEVIQPLINEEALDEKLVKLVEENEQNEINKNSQRLVDIELEEIRAFEQTRLLEEALAERTKDSVVEDNLTGEYDSDLLNANLKKEEERIKLALDKKDDERLSEIAIEKIRKATQSKYIVQGLLAIAQNANNEEDFEDTPLEEILYEETSDEEASMEETPVEEVPVEEVPVEESPVEESPVEESPVEESQVEESQVEEAPVEEAPVEEAPVEVAEPVCSKPKRKIQIIKSSLNGKDILLVKREVADAAGLIDGNKTLKNPGLAKEAKALGENELENDENSSKPSKEGISIVNEDGIEYVVVNGVKIDTKNKVVKTLGLEGKIEKEVEHQEITKDDVTAETPLEDTESSIRKELKKKNSKKKRKRIFIWIIIIAILVGGTYIYNFYNTNRRLPWATEKLTGDAAITYTDTKVEEQITNPKVTINGSLEAANLQTVVLRTNGAIKSINFKEGDAVKKGDILVTVDDTTEQYNIANLESQLKSSKLTGNANNVRLIELQLENAKNNLEYTMAKANFDGVVAEQGWEVGDYNSLTVSNTKNMIIADLSQFKATVAIDELDIGYVEVGEDVELTFDSLPGTIVKAYVSSIPMLGYYSKQGFGVLNVEITIPDPPKQLKTGFTFSGTIVSGKEESIVVVNQAAITSNGDDSIVKMKMPDGSLKEIPVTIRYLGENKCQILSGDVYIGDTVVIENAQSFAEKNGIRVGK